MRSTATGPGCFSRLSTAAFKNGAPLTDAEIKDAVVRTLAKIAPEARGQALASSVNLREQLDLDSMDILNFVVGLHTALGVDVPEADYPKFATLDGGVEYLVARRPCSSTSSSPSI